MSQVLLPLFYLPPISWFSIFIKQENEIIFEQFENFPKQTYRNRTNIYGANGKLPLIIPIHHNGKRVLKETQISYAENWQKLHWKSIKTAYQSSPYFEFYEDRLAQIFLKQEKFLIDFNLNALDVLQKILKTEKAYSLNNEYQKNPEPLDYREKFSAKVNSDADLEIYYQIFAERYGFIKDLSVVDLLCNKGPEALSYINSIHF